MTNNMDLWSNVNETTTVGQVFCDELFTHGLLWIHNSYVSISVTYYYHYVLLKAELNISVLL